MTTDDTLHNQLCCVIHQELLQRFPGIPYLSVLDAAVHTAEAVEREFAVTVRGGVNYGTH